MPLERSHVGPFAPREYRYSWVSSGPLTASTQIKSAQGLVGGFIITALDDTGTAHVALYDSEDDILGGKEIIMELTIPDKHDNVQAGSIHGFENGVQAFDGIYMEVIAGSVRAIVYYR